MPEYQNQTNNSTLPKLPFERPRAENTVQVNSPGDYVCQCAENKILADRKSLAQSGMELGLNTGEIARLGSALLYHMSSSDRQTKLEAARALFRVLENNQPFEGDPGFQAAYSGVKKSFWQKVLSTNHDETFLAVPEVRSAAFEQLNLIHATELNERLSKQLPSGEPKEKHDYRSEIRERMDEIREALKE